MKWLFRFWVVWMLPLVAVASEPDTSDFAKAKAFYDQHEDQQAEALFLELAKQPGFSDDEFGQINYYLMQLQWDREAFSDAFERGDAALAYFEASNNALWRGKTLYTLSMKNLITGGYETALQQVQEAYNQYELAGDTGRMVWALGRKALVFHDIGSYAKGIAASEEAETLHDQFSGNDAETQAMILGIRAINYDDQGNSEEAVAIYQQVLALKDQLSGESEILRTYNNLGNSLRKLGKLDEAEYYITLNLEASVRDGFRYGIATAKTNLGDIAARKGDFKRAIQLLDDAQEISFAINDAEKILDVLQQQHELYVRMDNSAKALTFLKQYHAVKDSLYDLDTRRQMQVLETRYQSEKKQQQLELKDAQLSQQQAQLRTGRVFLAGSGIAVVLIAIIALLNRNRIRKQQELALQQERIQSREAQIQAALDSQEQERSRYAQDLHDGFGQLISILSMKVKSVGEQNAPSNSAEWQQESEGLLTEMHAELKRICFDLKPRTLADHGLAAALDEFASRVNAAGDRTVHTDFFGLENRLPEATEVALFRIAQEWVNNILKYSDAAEITIQVTRDAQELTFLIEDNGQGFEREKLIHGTGNGWRNIQSRVDLIKGSLALETEPGQRGNALIVDVRQ